MPEVGANPQFGYLVKVIERLEKRIRDEARPFTDIAPLREARVRR